MPSKKPEDKAEKPVKASAIKAESPKAAKKPAPAKAAKPAAAGSKTPKAPSAKAAKLAAAGSKTPKAPSAKAAKPAAAGTKTPKAPSAKAVKTAPAKTKKAAPKKHSPEKAFIQNPSPEVVVLPQSQNKVFLIWRAQPELDESTDSWVIRTSFGEKARVPAASRSVFLTASGVFTVDIYRRLRDGSELLFLSKTTREEEYFSPPSSGQAEEILPRLNSSSQNFRRRISS